MAKLLLLQLAASVAGRVIRPLAAVHQFGRGNVSDDDGVV
jgi:hypothetical protein